MFYGLCRAKYFPFMRTTGKIVTMVLTPESPTTKEHASVGMLMKVTPSTAAKLDDYRSALRPVSSRATVLRAALAEYLKRQAEPVNVVPAPLPAPAKSCR